MCVVRWSFVFAQFSANKFMYMANQFVGSMEIYYMEYDINVIFFRNSLRQHHR